MSFDSEGNVVFVPFGYSPRKAIGQILRRSEAISDERPKLLTIMTPTPNEYQWFVFDRDMESNMRRLGKKETHDADQVES